jgi:hypothetical protein
MCRLVSQRTTHNGEAMGILNCYKTKRGGVVFRYGILEALWENSRCAQSKTGEHVSGTDVQTPCSTDSSGASVDGRLNTNNPPAMPQNAQQQQMGVSDEKFTFPLCPPCVMCGVRPKYAAFVG